MENCENRNDPDLVQAFLRKWWVESVVVEVIVIMYNATFNYIVAVSFIGGGHRSTTDLLQVTDNLSHKIASNTPTLVVIGTDYIGSYESNIHTIMPTTDHN